MVAPPDFGYPPKFSLFRSSTDVSEQGANNESSSVRNHISLPPVWLQDPGLQSSSRA